MLPFFPKNLDPTIIGSVLNASTSSNNEETEIRWEINELKKVINYFNCSELEQEQQKFFQELEQLAQDIQPLGKLQTEQNGNDNESDNSDNTDNEESSEEDNESDADNDEAEVSVNY